METEFAEVARRGDSTGSRRLAAIAGNTSGSPIAFTSPACSLTGTNSGAFVVSSCPVGSSLGEGASARHQRRFRFTQRLLVTAQLFFLGWNLRCQILQRRVLLVGGGAGGAKLRRDQGGGGGGFA